MFNAHILIFKIFYKVFNKVKYFYAYKKSLKKSGYMTDSDFLRNLNIRSKNINYEKLLSEKVMKNNSFNLLDLSKNKEFILSNISGANKLKIINEANDICNHKFNLLGSGKINVSYELNPEGVEGYCYSMRVDNKDLKEIESKIKNKIHSFSSSMDNNYIQNLDYNPIDWHIDFKSGYRWEEGTWYKKIKFGHIPGADIKVPWELSRFNHLVTLGQAYLITNDEKYTSEFIYQITDWVENNSPQFSVNWACAMDAAIRACNWIIGFSYFTRSPLISKKFFFMFVKNIFVCGKHIRDNLEKGIFEVGTNHYLSDIVGLLYIGLLFIKTKRGRKWFNFAFKELQKQMDSQVYDDGCDFEASTCYHRLALELFFYPTFFIINNSNDCSKDSFSEIGEKIFSIKYINKLYRMFEVLLFNLNHKGMMPQIGDNDNGRLHIFNSREILDMRYLLTIGTIFFKESKFKIREFGFCEEALWIFGKKGFKIWNNINENSINYISSKAFNEAGLYIMRNGRNHMVISGGSNGQGGYGGHAHNDKLSFVLSINGENIIVDPGSYLYTPLPEYRNKFRSTFFHNTIVVDNKEQNRFNSKSLFLLENDAPVKINSWKSTNTYDFFDAEHYGYSRLNDVVLHRRQIIFNKEDSCWFIKDILTGTGKHTFDLYFHLDSGLNYKIEKDELSISIYAHNGRKLRIYPVVTNNTDILIEDGFVSYGYGQKVNSKVLKYSKKGALPAEFLFALTFDDFNYSETYINDFINMLSTEK